MSEDLLRPVQDNYDVRNIIFMTIFDSFIRHKLRYR
jgi:hypothetical protein